MFRRRKGGERSNVGHRFLKGLLLKQADDTRVLEQHRALGLFSGRWSSTVGVEDGEAVTCMTSLGY